MDFALFGLCAIAFLLFLGSPLKVGLCIIAGIAARFAIKAYDERKAAAERQERAERARQEENYYRR